jgi:putative DNA primase/helicase
VKLTNHNQWINWGYVQREKGITKIPMGKNGRAINVNNPKCHKTFKEATKIHTQNHSLFSGIGFVFTEDDPFVSIDLDSVNMWYGWQEIIKKMDSYTEISPSGNGYHIVVEGFFPGEMNGCKIGSHKDGGIEIWDNGHFLTITLDVFDEYYEVNSRQEELNWLVRGMDDKGLMNKILVSEYSQKFQHLWEGRWSLEGFASQSEAELSFCRILANNHCPMHQIDRLYRRSKLRRDKWTEKRGTETYGLWTLKKALDGKNQVND